MLVGGERRGAAPGVNCCWSLLAPGLTRLLDKEVSTLQIKETHMVHC